MLNDLIDQFIDIYNNDIKQREDSWYEIMGRTIGGSEIAAIMGLSPYSSFYKVVESKIDICKGNKPWNSIDSLSCWWGTVFEDVITKFVELDLGNPVKGTGICIQKYEGHRNSPDGYIVANFYKKDDKYELWTTNLPKDIIELSLIMLLEFKCPITRKVTGDIPKYYKPQVLSGLSVSPIAHKGLFIDSIFKKCSISQLGYNPEYDNSFHKKITKDLNPIAWGSITIYCASNNKKIDTIKTIYDKYFDMPFTETDIIDLGDASYEVFNDTMMLINDKTLTPAPTTIKFFDGRGDNDIINLNKKNNHYIFAILPWKLFDISYVPIDREPNFLENIYPTIQKVHELVNESIKDSNFYERIKIADLCNNIYD